MYPWDKYKFCRVNKKDDGPEIRLNRENQIQTIELQGRKIQNFQLDVQLDKPRLNQRYSQNVEIINQVGHGRETVETD